MEGGIIVAAVKDLFRFVDRDAMKVVADVGAIAPRDAVTAAEHVALDEGRASAAAAARDAENRAVETEARATTGDPIDVASGEVILRQTDVALAGVLPLVLERTHVSSYRCGRWFGISWASTLDQHLEVTDNGVYLAAADGMVLA